MRDNIFEDRLRKLLKPGESTRGEALMGAYVGARNKLIENVYDEIRGTEPNLTDHGWRHIQNVQDNAIKLLPNLDDNADTLSPLEMYCLGMSILFHDVGNIISRKDHEQSIGGIFDAARGQSAEIRREKNPRAPGVRLAHRKRQRRNARYVERTVGP